MNTLNIIFEAVQDYDTVFTSEHLSQLNTGFWVSMGVTAGIVVLMHVVFWGIFKKKSPEDNAKKD